MTSVVLSRVAGRVAGAAEEAATAGWNELRPYARAPLGAAGRDALCADMTSHMEILLRCLEEDREMLGAEMEEVAAIGDSAWTPEQAMPLSARVRLHRIVVRTLWAVIHEEFVRRPAGGAVPWRLVQARLRELEGKIISEAARRQLGADPQGRPGEALDERDALGYLLGGDVPAFLAARGRAESPLTLASAHTVAVIGVRGHESEAAAGWFETVGAKAAARIETGPYRPYFEARPIGVVLLIPGARTEATRDVAAAIASAIDDCPAPPLLRPAAGIGGVHRGPEGVAPSYREAMRALEVARAGAALPAVLSFDQALPYELLMREPRRGRDLLAICIDPLLATKGGEELIATIEAYYETAGNLAETGRRLGVHRHTVVERLERIAKIAGRSPSEPDQRLLFELALAARRALPAAETRPFRERRSPPS